MIGHFLGNNMSSIKLNELPSAFISQKLLTTEEKEFETHRPSGGQWKPEIASKLGWILYSKNDDYDEYKRDPLGWSRVKPPVKSTFGRHLK